jgi:hypothetical protein
MEATLFASYALQLRSETRMTGGKGDDAMETTTTSPEFPLANDANGDPIEIPPQAVRFRVRKMPSGRAGRPKAVFDRHSGRQLEVPLTVTLDELAERVTESGRHRLEAIDANGRTISGCMAFTEVEIDEEDEEEQETRWSGGGEHAHLIALVEKVVDSNTRVMEAMASAFGQVRPNRQPMMLETAGPAPGAAAPPQNPGGLMGSLGEMMQMGQQLGGLVQNIMAMIQMQKAAGLNMAGLGGTPPMPPDVPKGG